MQRRAILLFILFAVLAVFYASVSGRSVPEIMAEQKAQTEMFEQLDQRVLRQPRSDELSAAK